MTIEIKRSNPIPIQQKQNYTLKTSNIYFDPSNKSPNNFINNLERRYNYYYKNMSPLLTFKNK